jgi:hypothetical protein
MSTAPAHPVHASVAFLRIPRFESLDVAEQAARKERLADRVSAAIAPVPVAERLVLDAEDGLAVVMFGTPARAMDTALALHARGRGEPLQAGLGYGPLALTSRANDARVFGDGLSQAATAARFATAEGLLVTEAFAKALQAAAPDRASDLAHAGEFTDTSVRMHAFYTPDLQRRVMRQRKLAVFALGGTILIMLLGVVGRDLYQPLFQSRPAIVKLDIRPQGEVFVDGNAVGRVPPLTQIEVPPGRHRITVRAAGARPFEVNVDLEPGQRLALAHTFPAPAPQRPSLWRDFKRRFGS